MPDGAVTLRLTLPAAIAKVVVKFAKTNDISYESAIKMFLGEISFRFDEGEAMFLSPAFQRALRQVREEHFGVINETAIAFDLSKVHKSTRTKSGFVGVYANGKGFRATGKAGPNNPGEKSLGTYPTAEEAAWRRYCYYKQSKLPYGELEVEMQRWRNGELGERFKGTDEELIEEIRKHAGHTGMLEEIFGSDGNNAPRKSSGVTISNEKPKPPDVKIVPLGLSKEVADEIFGPDED